MAKIKKEKSTTEKVVRAIKKVFASEEEQYQSVLAEYKEKYLPPEYNQLELLDKLTDDTIDHYISITTRGDGKSFNYISALGYIAYQLDLPSMLIVRHWTLQNAMQDLVMTVLSTTGWCDVSKITWETTTDYLICIYGVHELFIITDLNRASDLKQHSATLKRFGIICYDEFLTLTDDYVPNEYDKMRTIYKSIDRVPNRPFIKYPKVIYLGNPVNFSSPLLPALHIYNYLQSHPINTIKQYNNVLLEMRRNEHRNEGKNLRAFPDANDADVTGEFQFDSYRLQTPEQYINELNNGQIVKIRLDNHLMMSIVKNHKIIVGIEKTDNNENFTLSLNDCNDNRMYLSERFYKDNFYKRYEKGHVEYKDAFSKEYITQQNPDLMRINLYRLFPKAIEFEKEEVYNKAVENSYLKELARKFEGI